MPAGKGVLPEGVDAYGKSLRAHLDGDVVLEIVERDDGFIDVSRGGPAAYFAPYRDWPPVEKQAMRYVTGRVLDVGCGAGRVAAYLRDRGHEVVGVDNSPEAVRICRELGIDARPMSVTHVSRKSLGSFDTIVMMGNNFGLLGGLRRGRWLLRRFAAMTPDGGQIVASSLDPYTTDDADHLAYHHWNRRRGRMPGQLRLRVRFRGSATPWFDYLIVSPDEMRSLAAGTGWSVDTRIDGEGGLYAAVLVKDPSSA